MPAVGQSGQRVCCGQILQLSHHAAQGFLVRLQGVVTLLQALAQLANVAGCHAQTDQKAGEDEPLHQVEGEAAGVCEVVVFDGDQCAKAGQCQPRVDQEVPARQLEYAEDHDIGVDHDQTAAQWPGKGKQIGDQQNCHCYLRVGHAWILQAQIPVAAKQGEKDQLCAYAEPDVAEHQPDRSLILSRYPSHADHHVGNQVIELSQVKALQSQRLELGVLCILQIDHVRCLVFV